MSRIGNKPVPVPDGVQITIQDRVVSVNGPLGDLQYEHRPEVDVALQEDPRQIVVTRRSDERAARAYHGLTRALINSMVEGVTRGYEKRLEIVGVGYLGSLEGDKLTLRVGFANEITVRVPEKLDVTCPDQTHIVVKGCDKQLVGQFAASVRAVRKPEPYKGKGIRYQGEQVKLKPGKAAT